MKVLCHQTCLESVSGDEWLYSNIWTPSQGTLFNIHLSDRLFLPRTGILLITVIIPGLLQEINTFLFLALKIYLIILKHIKSLILLKKLVFY